MGRPRTRGQNKHFRSDGQLQSKGTKHAATINRAHHQEGGAPPADSLAPRIPTSKPRISLAPLLKNKAVHGKQHHRVRKPEVKKSEWLQFIEVGLENGRGGARARIQDAITRVHEEVIEKLAASKGVSSDFYQSVKTEAQIIAAPLGEEEIQSVANRNGITTTHVINIGQQVAKFLKRIEKEAASLETHWKQWESLQDEFQGLGIEVFGFLRFPDSNKTQQPGGFKRDMLLLYAEHDQRAEELEKEIDDISHKALQRMKKSEKELDAVAKKEQNNLLQAIMMG